jgi:hypothetical protein
MSDHALLSPSRAHRYMRCPGSVREEAKYPEPPSGPNAIDGTHTHTLLEHCVKADLGDPTTMVGVKMKDDDGEFVVDTDRAARVKVAIDYVRQRHAELGGSVLAERRVDPSYLLGRSDMSGTVDIRIMGTQVLEIIDYKDGMSPVESDGNEQLELYALGALAELKVLLSLPFPFTAVRMTIIQPKMALRGGDPIVSVEKSVDEVLGLVGKYVHGAAMTEKPDAPLIPGEKQCKWCRASGCAARVNASLAVAGVAFPVVGVEVGQQIAQQDPAALSDDKLREILEAAPMMRQMIEQAEAEALRRLESGKPIPGLKLVNGRGSQAWTLPEEQIAEKLKGMGVPKDAIYKTSVVSPAQAKKITWSNRKGEQKSLSPRQLKTLETEYIVKLGGKLTVAPESDPRPAVIRDVAPLFSAVESAPAPASLPAWLV